MPDHQAAPGPATGPWPEWRQKKRRRYDRVHGVVEASTTVQREDDKLQAKHRESESGRGALGTGY